MPQTRSADALEAAEPDLFRQRPHVARDISMPTFSGRPAGNGKRWLNLFLRFATCHGWDDSFKLAFVLYYLHDMALVWFENQDFLSWTIFVNEFKKYYADESQRSCQAAEELRSRAQRQGETCHDYVQAVLQLCRESDATMTEAQRVGHVLKGIA